jgi:transketolase
LLETIGEKSSIFVIEDHAPVGALGDTLLNVGHRLGLWRDRVLRKFAVEGYPACGAPSEVLKYHGLDGASLAARIFQ